MPLVLYHPICGKCTDIDAISCGACMEKLLSQFPSTCKWISTHPNINSKLAMYQYLYSYIFKNKNCKNLLDDIIAQDGNK